MLRLFVAFTDREPAVNGRWVFETDDGWKTLQQLPAPPALVCADFAEYLSTPAGT